MTKHPGSDDGRGGSAPVDAALRQHAIEAVHTSFAISAGAGSGKTSVLVERLVQHLLAGVAPDRIAAITFTEKAAGELSARTRDRLEERRQKTPDDPRLQQALERFGELTLSTIHSFCQGLLQQEPLEAGWAPDTTILGDLPDPALEATYAAWRAGFDRRHPEEAPWVRAWAQETSFQPGQPSIREAARALLENRDLTPLIASQAQLQAQAETPERVCEGGRAALAALKGALSACLAPRACKLFLKCAPFVAALDEALDQEPASVALREALELEAPKVGGAGTKKDWPSGGKEAVLAAVEALRAWREGSRRRIGERLHALLITDLVEHGVGAILAARRAGARADFSDLLFRAREVLLFRPEARRRLAARYQVLLVDEVQDTDPIQAEVASLLTRPPGAEGAWNAVPPLPGSLFAVGDPRQSIYRFRRADVATWGELQALVAQAGEAVALRQNFRSVPGLVAWVNQIFGADPDYTPQVASRSATTGALPPVQILQCDTPEAEIAAAAAYLRRILDDPLAQIQDERSKETTEATRRRRVRAGDVMILLPSWSNADALQARLRRAGIPATVEGDTRLFARDEARLMLEALRAIEEPSDTAAVLCVLRGLFGFSHAELAQHHLAGGRWDPTWRRQPLGPVAGALATLRALHHQRGRRGWSAILLDLLDETGASAMWALTDRRWTALANLDRLRALLRGFEAEALAPGEVVDALERLAQRGHPEQPTLDSHADAVRITTYFKAKGLEAPVVLLVCARRKEQSPTAIVLREHGTLAIKVSNDLCPPGWQDLVQEERAALAAERRRWMYVAVTRARDHLVLVQSPKADLFSLHLAASSTDLAPALAAASLGEAPDSRATFRDLDPAIDAALETPLAEGAIDRGGLDRALAEAAAIQAARRAARRWQPLDRPRAAGGWLGLPRSAVVHETLRRLRHDRPTDPAEAAEILRHQAREAALSEADQRWCAAALNALLADPHLQAAAHAPRVLQDVSLLAEDQDTALAGRADLCYATDDRLQQWVVVDWRAHLQQGSHTFYERYPRRLRRVAQALLSQTLGFPVTVSVHLLRVPPLPDDAPPSPADLQDAALEDVHEALVPLTRWALGLPVPPEVIHEVLHEGNGPLRVLATLELAWPAQRLGVGLDLDPSEQRDLIAAGWTLLEADTRQPGWHTSLEAQVRAIFPPEESEDDGEDEDKDEA